MENSAQEAAALRENIVTFIKEVEDRATLVEREA
jgi:hypothetical protein